MRPLLAAVVLVAALVACEPLADDGYRGEPYATFMGGVFEDQPGLIHRDDLRAAVFWSPGDATVEDFEVLVEQESTGQPVGIPNDYVLHLFDTVPDELLIVSEEDVGPWAIGRVLVYADENDNGRRDEDETFLGAVLHAAMLYAPDALSASSSPTGRDLPAGFHHVVLPLACGALPAAGAPRGDCGVDLGAPCSADADCSPGICLSQQTHLTFHWPGGACALPGPDPAAATVSCLPAGAGRIAVLPGGPVRSYWVRGCTTDADCVRDDEPYVCDVGAGACVPGQPLRISLMTDPQPAPFCAPDSPEAQPPAPPTR